MHESGIADTMNGIHVPAGNGATETEVDVVTKQTTETLMAGERIMEALDLADKERATFEEYRETMARLSKNDALRLQPPPRNPVLAAYDLEPETYVLKVVEKVPSTALQDALLVLPFGKVVSLMVYLDVWVEKVLPSLFFFSSLIMYLFTGFEYHARGKDRIFSFEDTSSSNCCQPHHASNTNSSPKTLTHCSARPQGRYRI